MLSAKTRSFTMRSSPAFGADRLNFASARPHLSHCRLCEQQRLGKGAWPKGHTFRGVRQTSAAPASGRMTRPSVEPHPTNASRRLSDVHLRTRSGEPDRNFQLDKRRPCGIKEKCQKYLLRAGGPWSGSKFLNAKRRAAKSDP